MEKIVIEMTETEAMVLEAMIQAILNDTFTEELFSKILKIENEKERTEECNLFLIGELSLKKIRDNLKDKREQRSEKRNA